MKHYSTSGALDVDTTAEPPTRVTHIAREFTSSDVTSGDRAWTNQRSHVCYFPSPTRPSRPPLHSVRGKYLVVISADSRPAVNLSSDLFTRSSRCHRRRRPVSRAFVINNRPDCQVPAEISSLFWSLRAEPFSVSVRFDLFMLPIAHLEWGGGGYVSLLWVVPKRSCVVSTCGYVVIR